jgi:hypothetical protein
MIGERLLRQARYEFELQRARMREAERAARAYRKEQDRSLVEKRLRILGTGAKGKRMSE